MNLLSILETYQKAIPYFEALNQDANNHKSYKDN